MQFINVLMLHQKYHDPEKRIFQVQNSLWKNLLNN